MNNVRELVIDNKKGYGFDTNRWYHHSKVIGAEVYVNGEKKNVKRPTTWASVYLNIANVLVEYTNKCSNFETDFNEEMDKFLKHYGFGHNASFSPRLYTDETSSFIRSCIYAGSKTRQFKIWKDKKICAVYSGEIVWVLNVLAFALGRNGYDVKIVVRYICREDMDSSDRSSYKKVNLENVNGVNEGVYRKSEEMSEDKMDMIIGLLKGVNETLSVVERMLEKG
jgi:hypothetical protein